MLSAPGSYTGENTVFAGILQVQHDTALGTTDEGTVVMDGATLQVENLSSSFSEYLGLGGTGIVGEKEDSARTRPMNKTRNTVI